MDDPASVPVQGWVADKPRFTLFVTKTVYLDFTWPEIGESVTVWHQYWPAPAHVVRVIAGDAARARSRLVFVGDLSPLALLSFVTLCNGGIGEGPALGSHMEYRGICDRSLSRFEGTLGAEWPIERLLIAMTVDETSLWRWMQTFSIGWEEILGPRCVAMLERGLTLHVDGLFNGAIRESRQVHTEQLREWLLETPGSE